jgi:hypothetical protein
MFSARTIARPWVAISILLIGVQGFKGSKDTLCEEKEAARVVLSSPALAPRAAAQ